MRVALPLLAAYGVFLIWTSVALGWRGLHTVPAGVGSSSALGKIAALVASKSLARAPRSMPRTGLGGARPAEVAAVAGLLAVLGAAAGFAIFASLAGAAACAGLAGAGAFGAYRARCQARLAEARQAWPRLIEEMRVHIGSLGRSVPQALFEAGRSAPIELRPCFGAAEREWLVTTDFPRTLAALRAGLADPTADVVCETLLVAHEVGGTGLDRRLAALAEDRVAEAQGRRDALAHQAGVRFARRFVAAVPIGMALAGISIGTGRAAFASALGQVLVVIGLAAMAGCWTWAGRLMRIPDASRVFEGPPAGGDKGWKGDGR